MTREETKKIIAIMVTTYPNYKPNNLSETVDIWTMMLEDFTYQQIALALKSYILSNTSGFAPAISQLVELVRDTEKLEQGGELTELEAWSMVYKAICNSGYNAESEFAKLPEIVQKAVGNPANLKEWATMDIDTVQSVEQSHFIRVYRAEVERSKKVAVMPKEVKQRIESASRNAIEEKGSA